MTPSWTQKIASFDTETTGVDPFEAGIVSAALVMLNGDEVTETWEWSVDPGQPIPPSASRIHGVWEEDRAGRMDHGTAAQAIARALDYWWEAGYTVVVYNAAFDLTLLREVLRRECDIDWHPRGLVIDPMVIDRAMDKYRKGRRTLSAQCSHYGVQLSDAHNATADATAAALLARRMGEKWSSLLSVSGPDLMLVQQTLAHENNEGLKSWFIKTGRDPKEIIGGWPLREAS